MAERRLARAAASSPGSWSRGARRTAGRSLGIGLNVTTEGFPAELAEIATSLRIAGVELDAEAVLAGLLASLDEWLEAPGRGAGAWRERDALRGERVRWDDGEGVAAGHRRSGALLVETEDGRVALDAGEVHLSPP